MAPRKRSGNKTKTRKNTKRNSKRTMRRGPAITTERPSIGRLAAYGVRSILGMLPGVPFVTKLADFLFKSFGVAKQVDVTKDGVVKANSTSIVSTAASFIVTSGNILASTKLASNDGDYITSKYSSSRVKSFSVMVSPDNNQSQQSGEIILGLSPFWEISTPYGTNQYPTPAGVNGMYMSIRGPANKPLSLTFRPRPSDGRAYQFSDHGDRYAWIQMIYMKENRTSYNQFNSDEVSFQIAISGKVETRSINGRMHGNHITDTIEDLLNKTGMVIQDLTTKKTYELDATNLSQQPSNERSGGINVVGHLRPDPTKLTLASMEI